jgi:hypothetical protein
MEFAEGKEVMCTKEYERDYGHNTATTLRLRRGAGTRTRSRKRRALAAQSASEATGGQSAAAQPTSGALRRPGQSDRWPATQSA